jgi:putative transposase
VVGPKDKRVEGLYLIEKYKAQRARVSRLLGLHISTLGYEPRSRNDEVIREKIGTLAACHRRFGHPRLFVLLKREMVNVNHKRSRRVYRELGLQIGRRKRKKLASCPRLPSTKASIPNEVWAIDFMFDYLESGRRLKVFTIVDEFSKWSPGLLVDHSIKGHDVVAYLDHLSAG